MGVSCYGGHAAGEIAPRGGKSGTSREGKREGYSCVVKLEGGRRASGAVDLEEELNEGETEISARRVPRDDYFGRRDWSVKGIWWWMQKGEVSD